MHHLSWGFLIKSDEDLEHVLDVIKENNNFFRDEQLGISCIFQDKSTQKYYLCAISNKNYNNGLFILKRSEVKVFCPLNYNATQHRIFWRTGKHIISPFS